MKATKFWTFILAICMFNLTTNCKPGKEKGKGNDEVSAIGTIDVLTTAMEFQVVNEISSGINTFKYKNESNDVHFFVLEKLPEGVRIEDYKNELIPPFKEATILMNQGKMEEAFAQFEKIPAWFNEVRLFGGVGLLSPNTTAEITLNLEPGYYAMECYVRMPNGLPHVFFGMLEEIHVTDKIRNAKFPEADVTLTISSDNGIEWDNSLKTGENIISVFFQDQKKYANFMGHDVNLVKLEEGAEIDELERWINSADLKAFTSPEPAGFTFLGGAQDMEAGNTAFFKVNIEKGDYVFISEIANASKRKMLKRFTVQ